MTRDRATLELVGVSLHGRQWHAHLARDLNVDLRTLQRWDKSQFDIPPGIWPDLAELCRKRGLYLAVLARELDTIPEVSDSTPIRPIVVIDRAEPREFTPSPELAYGNQRIPKMGTHWEGVDPSDWCDPFSWQGDYVWVRTPGGVNRLMQSDEFWDWVKRAGATMKTIPDLSDS